MMALLTGRPARGATAGRVDPAAGTLVLVADGGWLNGCTESDASHG